MISGSGKEVPLCEFALQLAEQRDLLSRFSAFGATLIPRLWASIMMTRTISIVPLLVSILEMRYGQFSSCPPGIPATGSAKSSRFQNHQYSSQLPTP